MHKSFFSWLQFPFILVDLQQTETGLLKKTLSGLNLDYFEQNLKINTSVDTLFYSFITYEENYSELLKNFRNDLFIVHNTAEEQFINFPYALKNYLRFFPGNTLDFEKVKGLNNIDTILAPTEGAALFLKLNKVDSSRIKALPFPAEIIRPEKSKNIIIYCEYSNSNWKKLLKSLNNLAGRNPVKIFFEDAVKEELPEITREINRYYFDIKAEPAENYKPETGILYFDLRTGFKSSLRCIQSVINNIPVVTYNDIFKTDIKDYAYFISEHETWKNPEKFLSFKPVSINNLSHKFSSENFQKSLRKIIKDDLKQYQSFYENYKNKKTTPGLNTLKQLKNLSEQVKQVKKLNGDNSALKITEVSAHPWLSENLTPTFNSTLKGDCLIFNCYFDNSEQNKIIEDITRAANNFSYIIIICNSEYSPFPVTVNLISLLKDFNIIQKTYFGNPELRLLEKEYFLLVLKGKNNNYTEPDGLILEGSQFYYISLSAINRELELKFIESGRYELSILPRDYYEDIRPENYQYYGLLKSNFHKLLLKRNNFFIRHTLPSENSSPENGYYILIFPWEFGKLPASLVRHINNEVDQLWCPSNYVKELHKASGIIAHKLKVVPNGIHPEIFNPDVTPLELNTRKKFRFLFNGGLIYRKGIDILLKAYTEEFRAEDDVCLLIKAFGQETYYKEKIFENIRQLQTEPDKPEILLLEENLPVDRMGGLYTSSNCYVQPYRGEGFCMPLAEAMACGLPVITTGFGPSLDFCSFNNSYLLNYSLVEIKEGEELNALAAEVDIEHLKMALRRVFENREEAEIKGKKAHLDITEKYNWASVFKIADAEIQQLKQTEVYRQNIVGRAEELENILENCHNYSKKEIKNYLYELEQIADNSLFLKARAEAYNYLGKYRESLNLFTALLKKTPDKEIITKMAKILERLGDKKTAEYLRSKI